MQGIPGGTQQALAPHAGRAEKRSRELGVLPFECHQLEGVQVVNVDGHIEGSHSCNPMSNWHLCTCACIAACVGQPAPRAQGWHDNRRVLLTQQAELVCLPSSNPWIERAGKGVHSAWERMQLFGGKPAWLAREGAGAFSRRRQVRMDQGVLGDAGGGASTYHSMQHSTHGRQSTISPLTTRLFYCLEI